MTAEDSEACRLCLSTEMHRSYSFLLHNNNLEHLQAILALQTDLNDNSIKPTHICDDCDTVIKRFLKLKKVASENELFLIKYQQQILTKGLKAVKEIQERKSFEFANEDLNIFLPGIENKEIDDISTIKKEDFDVTDCTNEDIEARTSEMNRTVFPNQLSQNGEVDNYLKICSICGKTCRNKHVLKSHMHIHTSQIVKCPKCIPDHFLKGNNLKKHLKNCHKEADVPCEFPGCEKMFKSRDVMLRHIKSVHMLERSICPNCGTAVLNMAYHLETCNVDNLDNVTCKICNKQLSCKLYLSTHERTVHGPPNLEVCTICGKGVKDVKSHTKWKHSENNQKTNCCAVEGCDALFRTKQELRTHNNRVHLDLKTQCEICFQWLKSLPEHMSQVHQQDRKHVCSKVNNSDRKY